MKRTFCSRTGRFHGPAGYTLVEILVAATISLVLMLLVVNIVGTVGTSIASSRAALEMSNRLREAHARLTQDLQGITVTMSPPRDPAANEGYFEYTEGPAGPDSNPWDGAVDLEKPDTSLPLGYKPDTTVGDIDDMILFTTRNKTQPFVGKLGGTDTIQSPDAEVAWFVRGRTLYRRVLLVAPQCLNQLDASKDGMLDSTEWSTVSSESFFKGNDISVRRVVDSSGNVGLVPNTLGDLTKPENRYAHQPVAGQPDGYPYHPHYNRPNDWAILGMPLLTETADQNWFSYWFTNGLLPSPFVSPKTTMTELTPFDAWTNPIRYEELDRITGQMMSTTFGATRVGEDVVLTNVLGFDVKAWDPNAPILQYMSGTDPVGPALVPGDPGYKGALQAHVGDPTNPKAIGFGAYVDLGFYLAYTAPTGEPQPLFCNSNYDPSTGDGPRSDLQRVYDTWSTHYESNGEKEVGNTNSLTKDAATNGFDDDNNGVVDDVLEQETIAPYPVPLRGLQVKIRIFDPDSRQIREVTVVQKF